MDGISLPIDGLILVDVSIQTACLDAYVCTWTSNVKIHP